MAQKSNERKRLQVLKTYKMYIGGAFTRTESGRYIRWETPAGSLSNICQGSRKDFRNAVVSGRKSLAGWASRTAYNRAQILYRMAEMLEHHRSGFITPTTDELMIDLCIDRLVYYAGWADKYQQLFSAVNPVSGSYFNFSVPEPVGVVAVIAPPVGGLLSTVSAVAPIICGGNTCVVLASQVDPIGAIDFSEVLHTSDLPAGVVNILTGHDDELIDHFSSHMDVNALVFAGQDPAMRSKAGKLAAVNVKRMIDWSDQAWQTASAANPYMIMDLQEVKTTWHPIGY
jgi:acyl-CoA reductase-like NAD-dependent aldehyde dehydrogenase